MAAAVLLATFAAGTASVSALEHGTNAGGGNSGTTLRTATIGSNLADSPNGTWPACNAKCTNQLTSLPTADTADSIVAQFDGTIIAWRIRAGLPDTGQGGTSSGAQKIRLRVLRPVSGQTFKLVGQSQLEDMPTGHGTITKFSTSIPIQSGDFISLELQDPAATAYWTHQNEPGAFYNQWDPSQASGNTSSPTTINAASDEELLINADVESESDVPVGGVDTGAGGASGSGNGNLAVPLGIAALVLVAGGLLLRRRVAS